jgi:ABC-type sugar transport system ATPase subunit
MRQMAERGLGIVFVSHRLDEVRAVATTVTVLRDGRRVHTGALRELDDRALIRHMVGRDVEYERLGGRVVTGDEVMLAVQGLTRRPRFAEVSFVLRRGEVVGLAGLVGAGRTDLARCLAGADHWDAGAVRLRGESFRPRGPADAIARGVAYVPEDRKTQGLVLGLPARESIALASLRRFTRWGVLRRRDEHAAVRRQAVSVGLATDAVERVAGTLSGGNQQKVVLAKWLLANADVLIVDEPTRGVDVGAKTDIHRQLRSLADAGKAVLAISSELPEVLAISDRILVMREGRLAAEFAAARADAESVLAAALPGGRAA